MCGVAVCRGWRFLGWSTYARNGENIQKELFLHCKPIRKAGGCLAMQKLNGSNGMAFISDLHIKLTGVSKRGKITREDDISCKGKQKKMELRALLDSVIVRLTATQGS